MTKEKSLVVAVCRDWGQDLPNDLLHLILSKLWLGDAIRFQAVCKQWRVFSTEYLKEFGTPWLVQKRLGKYYITIYSPLAECKLGNDTIPLPSTETIINASIVCSKDGWLLMMSGRKIFFLNPFSKFRVPLPGLPRKAGPFSGFTFTSSPTSEDCIVCGIAPKCEYEFMLALKEFKFDVYTISIGDKDWRRTTTHVQDPYTRWPCKSNPVYHNGKFYTLCCGGWLMVFDPSNTHGSVLKPAESPYFYYCTNSCLLESEGQLIAVFRDDNRQRLSPIFIVCEWDEPNNKWHRVNDIGERVFFLSGTTSCAWKTTMKSLRNKIYFPNLCKNHMVFYCLEKKVIPNMGDDFSNRTMITGGCWMEPTQHGHNFSITTSFHPSDDSSGSEEDDDSSSEEDA